MKNRDFIFLSASVLVVVIFWMFFSILNTSQKSTVAAEVEKQIIPISSSFDIKVLKTLKDRQK